MRDKKAILTSLTKLVSILIVLMFFSSFRAICQSFDPTITPTHWTIEGEARAGFSSNFDFSAREVERGWWRYSREFGRPLNMKTYYLVTIPSEINDGNVDVQLLAKVLSGKKGSTFFLTVNGETIPKTRQEDYLDQVKTMLKDFKKTFYLECLEERLEKEEKKAKKLSKKVDRTNGRNKEKALNALTVQEEELEELQERVKVIYQLY